MSISHFKSLLVATLLACIATTAALAQSSASDVAALTAQLGLIEAEQPARALPGWRVPKKIIVTGSITAADLRDVAPSVEFVSASESAGRLKDADAVIGACNADVLAKAPQVRWIQVLSAGVEQCVAMPAVRERQPLLTNMQRVESGVIAEHAIALLLGLTRNLDGFIAHQARGNWARNDNASMQTLSDKTLLVVGLGGIGTEVARRANALGMRVIATRSSGKEGPAFVSYVGLSDELSTLAVQADVVVNTAPLTDATRHLFDAKFFALLKPSAYFINVARGQSVVTDDLVAALNDKRLAGAGLDVTDPEPLPVDHPLWRAANVIITPHVASSSDLPRSKQLVIARENLRRYIAGDKLLSVVDLQRGY